MVTPALPHDNLIAEVNARIGTPAARPGGDADRIDGVIPVVVVEPSAPEAVATVVGWASETGRTVLTRGGGTKLARIPAPVSTVDVLLSTRGLNAVEIHRHGDLTATVQAGATLSETNAVLAEHRQWLALDPPRGDRATIGGILATNDSGPRRQGHGTPRDLIIGMTLARADGVVARSGGIVVKNVAGYDLARLMTGSFGCLGVILNATFKLAPLAGASRTVSVTFPDIDRCVAYADELRAHAATPSALELAMPAVSMLVRFESVESVAEQQAYRAVALAEAQDGTAVVLSGANETAAWQAHGTRVFEGEGTLVKLSVVSAQLLPTLIWLNGEARSRRLEYEVIGRAGLGVLCLRLNGATSDQAELLNALRGRLPVGSGSAVLQEAHVDLMALVDVWGPIGDGMRVMQEVKRQFDPTATLNPGRGPGGL